MKHKMLMLVSLPVILQSAPTLAANCEVANTMYGAARAEVAQKRSGTWVLLKDVALSSNTVGYGPGGNMAFEATFYDGKAWLAQADTTQAGGVIGRHEFGVDEGNVFAVTATPQSWQALPVEGSLDSLAAIDAMLGDAIADMGCDKALLPFRIEGTARTVSWSAESKPAAVTGSFTDEPVVLVGIYSPANRNGFFAVGEMNIHVHGIFVQRKFAGHIGAVDMLPGAKLFIGQ